MLLNTPAVISHMTELLSNNKIHTLLLNTTNNRGKNKLANTEED